MINQGNSVYKVEKIGQHFNLYYQGHHFLTVINQIGTFNIRAHPGDDPNGWGTSVYVQPFFPGARFHSAVVHQVETTPEGVFIEAEGHVCHGKKDGIGFWSVELSITYDLETEHVECIGKYTVDLPDYGDILNLGDTNMIRIASNYLWRVPKLDGSSGNTGDMSSVSILYDGVEAKWTPLAPESATYWDDRKSASEVSIVVHGGENSYDSVAQGFDPISSPAAIKPTVKVDLKSCNPSTPIHVFGMMSIYKDELATNQYGREVYLHEEYWQDNIGITPIVLQKVHQKHFEFDLKITSFLPDSSL